MTHHWRFLLFSSLLIQSVLAGTTQKPNQSITGIKTFDSFVILQIEDYFADLFASNSTDCNCGKAKNANERAAMGALYMFGGRHTNISMPCAIECLEDTHTPFAHTLKGFRYLTGRMTPIDRDRALTHLHFAAEGNDRFGSLILADKIINSENPTLKQEKCIGAESMIFPIARELHFKNLHKMLKRRPRFLTNSLKHEVLFEDYEWKREKTPPFIDSELSHLRMLAKSGKSKQIFELGHVLIERDDPDSAKLLFDILSQGSNSGSDTAKAFLGQMYLSGIATERNIPKAVELLRESANVNNTFGLIYYGQLALNEVLQFSFGNNNVAEPFSIPVTEFDIHFDEQNQNSTKTELELLLEKEKSFMIDPELLKEYYSPELGRSYLGRTANVNAQSLYALAKIMLENNHGFGKNFETAYSYFSLASRMGHPGSRVYINTMMRMKPSLRTGCGDLSGLMENILDADFTRYVITEAQYFFARGEYDKALIRYEFGAQIGLKTGVLNSIYMYENGIIEDFEVFRLASKQIHKIVQEEREQSVFNSENMSELEPVIEPESDSAIENAEVEKTKVIFEDPVMKKRKLTHSDMQSEGIIFQLSRAMYYLSFANSRKLPVYDWSVRIKNIDMASFVQNRIGDYFFYGRGLLQPDYVNAYKWYNDKLQINNPFPALKLAYMSMTGLGTVQSLNNAERFLSHFKLSRNSQMQWTVLRVILSLQIKYPNIFTKKMILNNTDKLLRWLNRAADFLSRFDHFEDQKYASDSATYFDFPDERFADNRIFILGKTPEKHRENSKTIGLIFLLFIVSVFIFRKFYTFYRQRFHPHHE